MIVRRIIPSLIIAFATLQLVAQNGQIKWTDNEYKYNLNQSLMVNFNKPNAIFITSHGSNLFYRFKDEVFQLNSELNIISNFKIDPNVSVHAHFKVINNQLHIYSLNSESELGYKKFTVTHHIYSLDGKKISKATIASAELSKSNSNMYAGILKSESENGEYNVFAVKDDMRKDEAGVIHIKIPTNQPESASVVKSKISASHKAKECDLTDLYVSNKGEIISNLKIRPKSDKTHGSNFLFVQNQFDNIKSPIELRSDQLYYDNITLTEINEEIHIASFRLSNPDLKEKIEPVHDKIMIGKIDIVSNKIIGTKEFDFDRKIYAQIGLLDKDGNIRYKTVSHYSLRFVHNENKRFLLAERQYRTTMYNRPPAHYHLKIMSFELNNEMNIISQSVVPKASLNTKYGIYKNDYTSNYLATIYNDKLLIVYNGDESNLVQDKLNFFTISGTYDGTLNSSEIMYAYLENGSFIRKKGPTDEFAAPLLKNHYHFNGKYIYLAMNGRFGKIELDLD